jgi:hypothetical protein
MTSSLRVVVETGKASVREAVQDFVGESGRKFEWIEAGEDVDRDGRVLFGDAVRGAATTEG